MFYIHPIHHFLVFLLELGLENILVSFFFCWLHMLSVHLFTFDFICSNVLYSKLFVSSHECLSNVHNLLSFHKNNLERKIFVFEALTLINSGFLEGHSQERGAWGCSLT